MSGLAQYGLDGFDRMVRDSDGGWYSAEDVDATIATLRADLERVTGERDALREIVNASATEAHEAVYGQDLNGEPWAMRGALLSVIVRAALADKEQSE